MDFEPLEERPRLGEELRDEETFLEEDLLEDEERLLDLKLCELLDDVEELRDETLPLEDLPADDLYEDDDLAENDLFEDEDLYDEDGLTDRDDP